MSVEPTVADGLAQAVDPQLGEAWRLSGVAALASGERAAARRFLDSAIRVDPKSAGALSALGSVDESEGKYEAAFARYAAAWEIDDSHVAAAIGLTRVAHTLDLNALAIAVAETTVTRGVIDAELLRILGAARLQTRDYEGAAEALLASLRVEESADALADLGAAYVLLHRVDEAIAAGEHALGLDPSHAAATNILGSARAAQQSFDTASSLFERAIALGSEEAHINLGAMRLLLGDYRGGWPGFGWANPERRRNLPFASLPMWDGTPAPAQRLLIWPEQGIGDTIQLVRFVRRARALVGSVALACPPGTLELFGTVAGVDTLIDLREPPQLSLADLWIPTVRLPTVLNVELASIPAAAYLRADPARIERFRPHLTSALGLRVGLVWSGNPSHKRDAFRSCPLHLLERLNDVPGITWFALQQGAASLQVPRNGMKLVPIGAEIGDFADTAAIIEQLDLVITVDTSVAHLAGALGRNAWVLIPKQPDWRWQLAGDRSPWYPALRLFRQGDDGQWGPVVEAIAAALRKVKTRPLPTSRCTSANR